MQCLSRGLYKYVKILQYLEVKKLNETVHTFIEECQRYGFKLPESSGGRGGSPKWVTIHVSSLRGPLFAAYYFIFSFNE